jgi:small subunit ribosomal protein S10
MDFLRPKKLRIGLKAYEPKILDESCTKIVSVINDSGSKAIGPIPLPTKRRMYCVLRSPHVNKDSREHFEIRIHKRIIDIYPSTLNSAQSILRINLPSGVSTKIK